MADTVRLNIPTGSIAGWRSTFEAAKLIYWGARRNGKDENGALAEVLDHVLADPDDLRYPRIEPKMTEQDLNAAIRHAMNYHSLDARLDMADLAIADLITPEVMKHLAGETDMQVIERMSPEDRASIGVPEPMINL